MTGELGNDNDRGSGGMTLAGVSCTMAVTEELGE